MEAFSQTNPGFREATNDEPVQALCIIRGIRYCHGFATELRRLVPELTGALNARNIMNNEILHLNPECPEEFHPVSGIQIQRQRQPIAR
ncbi:uncharacterized protein N7479_009777 [Penicillium vulpinum]|uniref:uncharacterized protein n=1 Tax=Penicillium vulpinum TaxID=29845 RepID=UPI002547B450|nr:uncharacterized protein N7479_009777 [Penicillium vulpinum]KAJ5951364.1 hypothetical protein N7479_009777 [Penicillium vulpinum]